MAQRGQFVDRIRPQHLLQKGRRQSGFSGDLCGKIQHIRAALRGNGQILCHVDCDGDLAGGSRLHAPDCLVGLVLSGADLEGCDAKTGNLLNFAGHEGRIGGIATARIDRYRTGHRAAQRLPQRHTEHLGACILQCNLEGGDDMARRPLKAPIAGGDLDVADDRRPFLQRPARDHRSHQFHDVCKDFRGKNRQIAFTEPDSAVTQRDLDEAGGPQAAWQMQQNLGIALGCRIGRTQKDGSDGADNRHHGPLPMA